MHGENYEIGLKGEFFNQRLNFSTAVFQVKQRNVAVPDIEVIVAGQPEQRYKAEDGVETKGYEAELSGELMTGLQQAPEDMVRITSSYSFAENLPELTLGGGLRWQSEVFPSRNQGVGPNGEIPRQESYTVADLFARYQISDSLTASLNINNLFDKNYFESVGVYNYGSYGEPRNISASVRWDF